MKKQIIFGVRPRYIFTKKNFYSIIITMIFAKVIGSVESTIKHLHYEGLKLLLVQPLSKDLKEDGVPFLAVDSIDAGPGEVVLVIEEGWSAWQSVGKKELSPINRAIVAKVDGINYLNKSSENQETE